MTSFGIVRLFSFCFFIEKLHYRYNTVRLQSLRWTYLSRVEMLLFNWSWFVRLNESKCFCILFCSTLFSSWCWWPWFLKLMPLFTLLMVVSVNVCFLKCRIHFLTVFAVQGAYLTRHFITLLFDVVSLFLLDLLLFSRWFGATLNWGIRYSIHWPLT